jgi:dihydroorotase
MSITCLRGGRIIDPINEIDEIKDLYMKGETIINVENVATNAPMNVIDVKGKIVFPGLIDLRSHLKKISGGQSENISSISKAAAAGGYTTILLMPNVTPKADNPGTIQHIQDRIIKHAVVNILLCGCLTNGGKGETIAPLGSLKEIGVVAVSDCPMTPQNTQIFSKGIEYAAMFGLLVIDLPRDLSLSVSGSAHDGPQALKMGLSGYPRIAEELFVQRAISISKSVDTKIHLTSISSVGSVEMIEDAKKKGIQISADVTPHHLIFNEESIAEFNPNYKTSPPLREEIDRVNLIRGVLNETIDCVTSAHEPFEEHEKNVEYDLSPAGVIGLETAFSACYQILQKKDQFSWKKLVNLMSCNPAKILNISAGSLTEGRRADIAIFDPQLKWTYGENSRFSNASNSPFEKTKFKGKIVQTFVNGKSIFKHA